MDTAVSFGSVTRSFGATLALDDVSFTVPAGQVAALLGPNGAGKTTAISLMLGLIRPDRGQVTVFGRPPRQAAELDGIGAMLQSTTLVSGVTVRELVRLFAAFHPRRRPVDEVLREAGVDEVAHRRVETLSGGYRRRVMLAVALVGDPRLLFLDEPTTGMDALSRQSFWKQIRSLARDGRTAVFATHDLEEAGAVAQRVVVLHRGRIVGDGTPEEIRGRVGERVLRFRVADPPPQGTLEGLAGVVRVERDGAWYRITSRDGDATARQLIAQGIPVRDLEIAGASMEEAFTRLTKEEGRG